MASLYGGGTAFPGVLAPAVLAAEARCWDPDVEHEESIALPDVGTLSHEPLAVEARRVAGLRRLRTLLSHRLLTPTSRPVVLVIDPR